MSQQANFDSMMSYSGTGGCHSTPLAVPAAAFPGAAPEKPAARNSSQQFVGYGAAYHGGYSESHAGSHTGSHTGTWATEDSRPPALCVHHGSSSGQSRPKSVTTSTVVSGDQDESLLDITLTDTLNIPPTTSPSDHGTEVAGLISAEKDNNECIVGVAHQSTIVGVRLLGNRGLTDSEEAQALNHHINEIDIYSNSWGPPDGYGFYSPGTLTKEALKAGVQNGRNGNGVIFIFASGNGMTHDNCNGDGYVNSIYTVAKTSVQQGQNAWYSEVCAPALAATYGGSEEDRYLTTTTTTDECKTNGTQGTSFSAPIASGIIALALQANPYLTWRDVQHLIVLTSSRKGFNDTYSDWSVNGANKEFSQVLGYGLMDAEAMVSKAKTWATVPVQHTFTTRTRFPFISTRSDMLSSNTIFVSRSDSLIRCLEQVTVRIKFSYSKFRGVTELYLVSPSGTESNLLHFRYEDAIKYERRGSLTWTFMSVHFWWENPVGIWRLKFGSYKGYSVEERTTAPTTLSINTSDLKSVSTTTKSTLLPTTVTEPISTSKTTYSLRATTSDILSTETATIADWVTTDYFSLSTTSTTGSDSSYFNSNNKPVIIGGVVAGVILIGTIIVFISWKIIAGRVKDVDSTTTSTAPAVFSA
ncbi:PC3-like endoprotease variant B,Furin-like protease 2,Furin-like protease 1, isoform 1-CRR,Furin-like protease 1, isoforms 1/1-X/2,PC3-like endoprotease variant A,Proprotein convertase subtilisin/kexin type 5,Furin-like protease kpc-1,Proprotein convertase subtilisin/kexin type 4,Proprotein convertase subtilisin/kexin type 7,Furin,Proprotein convertase subtilisin/kexin type 6,Furin-1 [Mytilus edulis]|uniref:P/Homo B domain-containing protein n=1 Tax=Mytilus edulis TaxID=6550 RepID=A0A8S3TBJ9_MYTED|nr:PC3-like endoprotease variant B,Furin-like protease 2,Furin-like protease 1, isoform 1-CRR,Furin-like protease 1, isoforms 1/1-X/2,PC3-like endoprotease variant A,Proprotein convertase subtilisin/kexin type 5,Furin-like protease kpc-1,Proprotein convertase subtilisin/kexin type 4,Proprotein convertase subtilisin/kexin type 7,Furin,Proprotein convertase subtilisin/kexin type 6,Furin-1 [Mytilus edulis]